MERDVDNRMTVFILLISWRVTLVILGCRGGLLGVTIALLMAAGLRLCNTHFPTTSELSQFVLVSPTANRRMHEPLASILREDFRKRGQREIFKREIFERDVI